MTNKELVLRGIDSFRFLYLHGLLSDAEKRKVQTRLDKFAQKYGFETAMEAYRGEVDDECTT